MKFAAAFALLATAVISTVSAQTGSYTNFTNCGIDLDYPAQYATSAVALSPSPLCIGKQFCMTATGVLSAPITQGATYSIVGRWLGRVIYTDSQDVCALLAANGQACPIPAGPYNMNLCHTVKPNLPQSVSCKPQSSPSII